MIYLLNLAWTFVGSFIIYFVVLGIFGIIAALSMRKPWWQHLTSMKWAALVIAALAVFGQILRTSGAP